MDKKLFVYGTAVFLVFSVIAGWAATPTGPPPAETIKLRLATGLGSTHFQIVLLSEWTTELKKRTGGRVVVEIYPDAILFGHSKVPDAIMTGAVELGWNSSGEGWPNKNPLFEAPY